MQLRGNCLSSEVSPTTSLSLLSRGNAFVVENVHSKLTLYSKAASPGFSSSSYTFKPLNEILLPQNKNMDHKVVLVSETAVFSCSKPSYDDSDNDNSWIFGWDLRASNVKPCLEIFANVPLASIDVGCGGTLICCGTDNEIDSSILFYDVRSSKKLGEYCNAHTDTVTEVKFISKDDNYPEYGTYLVSASMDGLICTFDIAIADEDEACQSIMNAGSAIDRFDFLPPQCFQNHQGEKANSSSSSSSLLPKNPMPYVSCFTCAESFSIWDILTAERLIGTPDPRALLSEVGQCCDRVVSCIPIAIPSMVSAPTYAAALLSTNENGSFSLSRVLSKADLNESEIAKRKAAHAKDESALISFGGGNNSMNAAFIPLVSSWTKDDSSSSTVTAAMATAITGSTSLSSSTVGHSGEIRSVVALQPNSFGNLIPSQFQQQQQPSDEVSRFITVGEDGKMILWSCNMENSLTHQQLSEDDIDVEEDVNDKMEEEKHLKQKKKNFKVKQFQSMNKPSSHHSNSKQSRSNSLSQEEKKVKTTGPIHNPKYKLKLCENFETEGVCPYYEKCQFAHGQNELEKWTSKQRKDSLPKVQSPTQVEKKSPITPQIKSKKHLRAESDVTADSSSVVTGPTSSPFVHPNANPSNNSQQSASSPTSQASPISLDQSKSVEEGNPWFSKRNPLVQKDLMDQKKNDINPPINQKSYSSINPSKFSLSNEEKPMNGNISQPHESATSNLNTNKNSNNNSGIINTTSSSSSSGIPLFDEERMIKELEKIVLEGNDNASKPFSDTGYDIRESSMLFKNGFLQLPSFSSSPKTGETNQQGWRREVMGRSPYQDPNQFGAQSSLAQMSSYLASNNTNSSFGNFYEDLYLSNYRPVQADYSQYQYHQGQSSPYNYDQSNSHPTYENWPAYQSNFQQQQQQQQHHQQQPMRYPQMVSMPQVPTNANRYYHP